MASKEQILGILAGESGPMNRVVLSKRLGEPTSNFQNQLDRMEKQGLVQKNEQNEYTITEAGRQFALAEPLPDKPPPDEPPPDEIPPTDESLKTTEYQQFIELGRATGVVPMAFISQTTNHIWRGGDFRDLTWVWKGLTEMGVRPDLAQRWFHSWRSFLHQAIPPDLASSLVGAPQTTGEKGAVKGEAVAKGRRDYILGPNDTPIKVGEDLGDLDYEDAVRLSTVRAAAQARGVTVVGPQGQPATPGSMADEVVKIWKAFKETTGLQTKGKSYVVKPGEEGYVIEEVEEGKPTIIATPAPGNINPPSSFLIDGEGNVTEVPPGKPVVIKQPPTSPEPGKTFIVKQTPEGAVVEEYEAGKPIIINAPASPSSGMAPVLPFPVLGSDGKSVTDASGNPVYANIEPMLKWLGFQSEQKRADERHGALMGLVKTVRENFGDGIAALKAAAEEARKGTGAKTPAAEPQLYKCGDCGTEFVLPQQEFTEVKCPVPDCGRVYTREEVLAA